MYKTAFKSLASLLIMAASTLAATGQIVKDGIAYQILSVENRTCEVSSKDGLAYGGTVNIPATVVLNGLTFDVVGIRGWAFQFQSNLTAVIIPPSVKSIGEWAFSYTGISSIVIPNSVTYIGYCALRDCPNLASVTLPKDLNSIEREMFSNDKNLKRIEIPDNVQRILGSAFRAQD